MGSFRSLNIVCWYVGNDADNIIWKYLKYHPKDQVVDYMKKLTKEAIRYTMNEPKFIKDRNLT